MTFSLYTSTMNFERDENRLLLVSPVRLNNKASKNLLIVSSIFARLSATPTSTMQNRHWSSLNLPSKFSLRPLIVVIIVDFDTNDRFIYFRLDKILIYLPLATWSLIHLLTNSLMLHVLIISYQKFNNIVKNHIIGRKWTSM